MILQYLKLAYLVEKFKSNCMWYFYINIDMNAYENNIDMNLFISKYIYHSKVDQWPMFSVASMPRY